MEELIKAKDEQIAKLNDLKELLKKQIITLQEENGKLKAEIFNIEEKIKQIPKESISKLDYESAFTSINEKLSVIMEKLDILVVNSESSSITNIRSTLEQSSKPEQQNNGLIKPSSLFSDSESSLEINSSQSHLESKLKEAIPETQEIPTSAASFNAADPRSLQRQILEMDYPKTGVIQCPRCSKMEFQEMPDPTRGAFSKKYYCKKCRQEWRFRY